MGTNMGLGMWVFWIAVVLVIVFLVRLMMDGVSSSTQSERSDSTSKTSVDILKERYARGEIDKDKFENMKKELEK